MSTRYFELGVLALSGRSNLAIIHLNLLGRILLIYDVDALLLIHALRILVFAFNSLSGVNTLAHVVIWSHILLLEVRQILIVYQLLLLVLLSDRVRIIIMGDVTHFIA